MHPFETLKAKVLEAWHHPSNRSDMTVDTICIPANGDPVSLIRVSLRLATLEGIGSYVSSKYNIQLVPDLPQCTDWDEEDWNNRELVDLGDMDEDQIPKHHSKYPGPYLMYKSCSENAAGRPSSLNKHFLRLKNVECCYGSVYIFKLKNGMSVDDPSSTYEDLDESIIESAFKGKGISNRESLRWLAAQKGLE